MYMQYGDFHEKNKKIQGVKIIGTPHHVSKKPNKQAMLSYDFEEKF